MAVALMLLASLEACATLPAASVSAANAVPVEIVTGGDDGLTLRLADAVRHKFERSALFALAPAGTLNVRSVGIPTHVGWEKAGGRTRVSYLLRLERAGRKVAESGGTCWETELEVCAREIVKAATAAAQQ